MKKPLDGIFLEVVSNIEDDNCLNEGVRKIEKEILSMLFGCKKYCSINKDESGLDVMKKIKKPHISRKSNAKFLIRPKYVKIV